ncbi:MAG: prolipoprotein diacylglyceryl transferase [Candidatus Uhrbacteria bacterium]|nr:prolipoprotein diacylglyceryl transferase [Candidatus Uhrbacteria bacterium]
MIPFLHSTTYQIFGLTLQTWGTFVAFGFVLGTSLAYRRAKQRGLNQQAILDLAFWIFIAAFLGARVFHVFFYEPAYYLIHPWDAIDPRQPGFSMFGGLTGAAIAFFIYARHHTLDWIQYADTLVWGLPWGCGVGRIGCFLIHDHPGTLTHFILGVKYPDGTVRHDLGLYLSIIGFLTGGLFIFLNRKQRHPGFWLGVYLVIEGLIRFSTDFLRILDHRYFGLTPTQYLAVPLVIIGIWFISPSLQKRG